jgi:hypothetical protein
MGAIFDVRHSDVLMCHDIQIKFHKDWFGNSKVEKGDIREQTARLSHKPTYIFINYGKYA